MFTYKLKEKAIKERKNSFGKFVLITDRDDLSNEEMLKYYISKFTIEDAYRTLKSDMEIYFTPPQIELFQNSETAV